MRSWQGFACTLAVIALGCKAPPAATDPFIGARVPPPSTGQVGAPPVATYGSAAPPVGGLYTPPGGYTGAPLAPVTPPPGSPPAAMPPPPTAAVPPPYSPPPYSNGAAPPVYQTPPPTLPGAAAPAAAPGSAPYSPPGGGWAPTSTTGGPETKSIYSRDDMQREIHPLAESARAGRLADAAEQEFDTSGAAPSEMSIDSPPQLTEDTLQRPLRDPRNSESVQPVSYNAPQGAPPRGVRGAYASTSPTSADAQPGGAQRVAATRPVTSGSGPADRGATYGYGNNYAWLQGQLEYSQATKQWKLRYIPIDGPTDKYGGSVILASSPALNGHKAGDFVSVKGQLGSTRTSQGSYAPEYHVTSVDRLTD